MTPLLIRHHLLAGWRNILKYKTQNLISILCLSVGTVLFAVVLWIVIGQWNSNIDEFDSNLVPVDMLLVADDGVTEPYPLGRSDFEKIRQLPSVDDLVFESSEYGPVKFCNAKGDKCLSYGLIQVISSSWLKRHHLRSAVTGREFDEVKSGTILVSDRSFDTDDLDGESPVGYACNDLAPIVYIDDIINTSNYWGVLDGIYIVDDGTLNLDIRDRESGKFRKLDPRSFFKNDLMVTLKDGATEKQLYKELTRTFPEPEIYLGRDQYEHRLAHILMIFVIVLLGASVLIVGLSGYLKMQIQLFGLRGREMTLRRCNGAKTLHLFLLLAAELLIAFLVVAGCSMLLTMAVADYAVPRIDLLFPDNKEYRVDYPFFFQMEACITFATFVISLIIAGIAAQKVVHQPLGKMAGKSYSPRTLMHSTMQVIQFFTTTIVIFLIGLVMMKVRDVVDSYHLSREPDEYKNVIIPNFDSDGFDHLVNAEAVARTCGHVFPVGHCPQDLPETNLAFREDTDMNRVVVQVVDTAMFRVMNIQVTTNEDDFRKYKNIERWDYLNKGLYPVYVEKNFAKQIRKQLGVKTVLKNQSPMSISGHEMIRIGYAPMLDNFKMEGHCVSQIYMVYPHSDFFDNPRKMQGFELVKGKDGSDIHHIGASLELILAKNGKYTDMIDELNELLDKEAELDPENKDMILGLKNGMQSAYDQWFTNLIPIHMLCQLSLILAIVCIASIVLSVYSSISLETRGRQKEVAIRKVHGAKTHDIVKLFFRYYLIILPIAFVLAGVVGIAGVYSIPQSDYFGSVLPEGDNTHVLLKLIFVFLATALVITLVTFLTIWHKVYKVAHTNAAEMIKKE